MRAAGRHGTLYIRSYSYVAGSANGSNTTTLVSKVQNGSYGTYNYTYDAVGNITAVSGGQSASYTYDAKNQLISETRGGTTYSYVYDGAGNLTSRTKLTGSGTNSYTYGNSQWKDLLTKYNGHTISYDTIGNPTTWYDGTTMTWVNGRRLSYISALSGGHAAMSFTYDAEGLRLTKTVGTGSSAVQHKYTWQGGKLIAEYNGSKNLEFFYDESGYPYSLYYNGNYYYYITNLQGDVMKVISASGTTVATYTYDAWGNVLTATGSLATINPLRYRGYYYDEETKLYYLQSRYYDPAIGRFINADEYVSTGQGFIGCNMFAYCNNNIINSKDPTGEHYTPGQIHDFVLEDICMHDPKKEYKNNYMIYKERYWGHTYGFCDLYDTTTHEIWELKRINSGATCSFLAARAQLSNYVRNGVFKHRTDTNYVIGGEKSTVDPNVFYKPDNDGEGVYVIGYFDTGMGVLFYDYQYVPSLKEAATCAAVVGVFFALSLLGGEVGAVAAFAIA